LGARKSQIVEVEVVYMNGVLSDALGWVTLVPKGPFHKKWTTKSDGGTADQVQV